MTWLTEDEHRALIRESVAALDPRDVDMFLTDGSARLSEAIEHYREIGPDHDDCDPMLHLAESLVASDDGDCERSSYAERTGRYVRRLLVCRVIRDISEVRS